MNEDLSGLSNEQIMAMLQSMPSEEGTPAIPQGTRARAAAGPQNDDVSGLSDEQLLAAIQSTPHEPAQPTTPEAQRLASLSPEQRQWLQQGRQQPTAQDFSGNQVPIDQLSEVAKMGHGVANTLENWGLGATQMAESLRSPARSAGQVAAPVTQPGMPSRESMLNSEATAMQIQHAPIDQTVSGAIGGVLPALVAPGGGAGSVLKGLAGAGAGGAAYGALEPVTAKGQRRGNIAKGAASFAAGEGVGRLGGALVNRVLSPAHGGRAATEIEKQRAKEVKVAEDLDFKVPVSGRTGGRYAAGLESVFADVPVTSGIQKRFTEANKANANSKVANQWGSDARVLTRDVIQADKQAAGKEFESFINSNSRVNYDGRMLSFMKGLKDNMQKLPKEEWDEDLKRIIKNLYDDIEPIWGRSKISISGEQYKLYRTRLNSAAARTFRAGNGDISRQVNDVIGALDDMAGRSVPKEVLDGYNAARKKWKALRIAEDSVDKSGNIVLSKYDRAIDKHKGGDTHRKIAQSMRIVNEKGPNSGTPARALAMATLAAPTLALTGIPGIGEESPLDYAKGVGLPLAVQAAMLNPYTARYIARHRGATGPLGNAFARLGPTALGVGGYDALQGPPQ